LLDVGLLALDDQRVAFCGDGNIVHAETGNRERNPIGVFAAAFDIIGWIIVVGGLSQIAVEQIGQMIETDRGAPQGREVKGPHNQILPRARWIRRSVEHRPAPAQLAGPDLASGTASAAQIELEKGAKISRGGVQIFPRRAARFGRA
jgi:hypothetical protein